MNQNKVSSIVKVQGLEFQRIFKCLWRHWRSSKVTNIFCLVCKEFYAVKYTNSKN